jgi:hypothetical protein
MRLNILTTREMAVQVEGGRSQLWQCPPKSKIRRTHLACPCIGPMPLCCVFEERLGQFLLMFGGECVVWGGKVGFWFGHKLTIQTSHSTVSQYSSLSYGKEILWSLSYFSQRYSCMLAPSKTRFGLPEVWSTRAGMRPLAEEFLRQLLVCSIDI